MPHSRWRRKTIELLNSHRALQAVMKPTQVGRQLGQRRALGHMNSRQCKPIRRSLAPMLNVEKCTYEPGFLSQAHLACSHRGRIAKGISECPDLPPQNPFYVLLAFFNLAACFLLAA